MIVTRIWREQEGKFFCVATKSPGGKWKDHFFSRTEFGEIRQLLKEYADGDIYWCLHGFNRRARQKEEAVPPKLCYADLDEVDPSTLGNLKPTIAIESSPGRYVGIWLTDKPITEELNRRLTYAIGADKGGWDFTQVLRFPGTRNYKYHTQPRVRLLWDDGPEFTIAQLDQWLPEEITDDKGEKLNAKDIYRRYQEQLPHWARREIFKGRPREGQRSEMIWKLEHALLDAGMTEDEAFAVIKASPWNKFRGRHNEDSQLRRELEKVVEHRIAREIAGHGAHILKNKKEKKEEDEVRGPQFNVIDLAEVEEEEIDWLWKPYFARGELTIVEGDPDVGKSYLTQIVCGYIADGRKLPVEKPSGEGPAKGRILYFDLENTAATVLKPRLVDNKIKNLTDFRQVDSFFTVDNEKAVEELYRVMEQVQPLVVVFDTINTYIGRADTHKASETQQALAYFRELAKDFECSVIVLRHLTKSSKGDKALYRGQGSIAFTGMARVVMTVAHHPEDDAWRVMSVTKCNIAKKPKALSYRIIGLRNDRSRLEWGEWLDLTSDDLLSTGPKKSGRSDSADGERDAEDFLRDKLANGPVEVERLKRDAERKSISWKHCARVAENFGFRKLKEKGTLGPRWALPREDQKN